MTSGLGYQEGEVNWGSSRVRNYSFLRCRHDEALDDFKVVNHASPARLQPALLFSFPTSLHSFRRNGDMGDVQLKHFRQNYLEGSNSTMLNTVDIWIPESFPIAPGDGKFWLMLVHTFCHGTYAERRS